MSTNDVREASNRFYSALNRMVQGDAAPMMDIWSHGKAVSTMHPIGGREVGWDEVKEPWSKVASMCSSGEVRVDKQVIEVLGDVAYETGFEVGYMVAAGEKLGIEHRVTNIYRREGGAWKIIHHHADAAPAMIALIARLQGKA